LRRPAATALVLELHRCSSGMIIRSGGTDAAQEMRMKAQESGPQALASLLAKVRACSACTDALPLGPRPILQLSTSATILVASQAPGSKVHEAGVPFSDASGDRLREWMGLSDKEFYDEKTIAIMPMGFCYPGRSGGGDAPPRAECAPLWRDQLLQLLPDVRLTLLVGSYAQQHVLGPAAITPRVKNFRDYLPDYFPLPHPSWRSRIWEERNPWFRADVLPALRSEIERTRAGDQERSPAGLKSTPGRRASS
jgi:uracil-DNA glycosylase